MLFVSWLTLKINIASLMVVTVLSGLQFESPLSLRPLSISYTYLVSAANHYSFNPFHFSSLGQESSRQ